MNNHCAILDDRVIIQWLYRQTTGKEQQKGKQFQSIVPGNISRLNSMIPLKQLHNSEYLGKYK